MGQEFHIAKPLGIRQYAYMANTQSTTPRDLTRETDSRSNNRRIQKLPDHLVHKIAAGEVVERPASVVKELVENSLDAGASSIEVFIEKGGQDLIQVRDNGQGIHSKDLPLTVTNHATSKIYTQDEFQCIQTLGFRGEALCTISNVSIFQITSRTKNSPEGYRLKKHGENDDVLEETGCDLGTDVQIRNLFFNTPARKKFLRSPATEFSHIQEMMTRFALCYEGVDFKLWHNQKVIFHVTQLMNLPNRIQKLLRYQEELRHIQSHTETTIPSISGYCSPAESSYGKKDRIYTYLNGRYIRDRVIMHAVSSAYRELAVDQTIPLAVIFIKADPASFDINVHPAKAEVRFENSQAMHELIRNTIRKELAKSRDIFQRNQPSPSFSKVGGLPKASFTYSNAKPFLFQKEKPIFDQNQPMVRDQENSQQLFDLPVFSSLRIIGQWRRSYIVCEKPLSR